jgi:hypothetical protein
MNIKKFGNQESLPDFDESLVNVDNYMDIYPTQEELDEVDRKILEGSMRAIQDDLYKIEEEVFWGETTMELQVQTD